MMELTTKLSCWLGDVTISNNRLGDLHVLIETEGGEDGEAKLGLSSGEARLIANALLNAADYVDREAARPQSHTTSSARALA